MSRRLLWWQDKMWESESENVMMMQVGDDFSLFIWSFGLSVLSYHLVFGDRRCRYVSDRNPDNIISTGGTILNNIAIHGNGYCDFERIAIQTFHCHFNDATLVTDNLFK